jgi:hypothetical protein
LFTYGLYRAPLINAVYKCSHVTYIPTVVISYSLINYPWIYKCFWNGAILDQIPLLTRTFPDKYSLCHDTSTTIQHVAWNYIWRLFSYTTTLEHTLNTVIWYRNNASCMEIPQYNRNSADKRNHYHDGENL